MNILLYFAFYFVDADACAGCLTITLIWEELRSELSIMLTDPRFGTFLGL